MFKLKNYITFYCISLLGYICFFITAILGGYTMFHSIQLDYQIHDGGMEFLFWGMLLLIKYYILHFILLLISFICLILEIFFRNKKITFVIPPVLKNINIFFLIIGCIFCFIPLYLFLLITWLS